MPSSNPPASEAVLDPWATCFLSSLVIRFLDSMGPAAQTVDYHRVMGSVEGFSNLNDPKAFLLDANNWVPHAVLRELIRRAELATGLKDVTYRAALACFAKPEGRQATLLETIARYLDDVSAVVQFSGLWASAYTNYLAMQAFARPDERQTLHILVRFLPPVDPLIGNSFLVQGNIEGFSKLYPFVDSVRCHVEYSQLKLSSVVAEFADAYSYHEEKSRASILQSTVKERATGKIVAVARACPLGTEPLTMWADGQALTCDRPGNNVPYCTVLRIERGGVLRAGPLQYELCEGALYNAPYTRYRFQWEERAHSTSERNPKQVISRLLLEHLAGLQSTQRRTLSIFIRNRALLQENAQLREELYGPTETGGMIGKSRVFQELMDLVRTVALTDATVLITGETGTGKERTARLIHQLSPRRAGRFLAVNCGALAESLLESELFGHERGAFSGAIAQKKGKFEQADGGTLFLDEIGEVSPAMQVKLLRVLQEREFQRVGGHHDIKVDVRIVTATNQDLTSLVADRKFRQDLFYRLHVFPLHLPPLRERADDIPDLAEQIIARHAQAQKKKIAGLSQEALQTLMKHQWPGNIRELENALERAITVVSPEASLIEVAHLPATVRQARGPIAGVKLDELVERVEWTLLTQELKQQRGLTGLMNRIEWALIRRAIKETGGNKTQAAKLLGRTYRWLRKAETDMPGSQDTTGSA